VLAVSRRSGDEIHPQPPNGDLRPFLVSRDVVVQRPLRSKCGHSLQAIWLILWVNSRQSSNATFAVSATAPVPEYEFDQTVSW
jgi:hypothetical protein